jgi:hypothetical protein
LCQRHEYFTNEWYRISMRDRIEPGVKVIQFDSRAVEAQHPKLPILPYMSPGATDSTHHPPIYCRFHFR